MDNFQNCDSLFIYHHNSTDPTVHDRDHEHLFIFNWVSWAPFTNSCWSVLSHRLYKFILLNKEPGYNAFRIYLEKSFVYALLEMLRYWEYVLHRKLSNIEKNPPNKRFKGIALYVPRFIPCAGCVSSSELPWIPLPRLYRTGNKGPVPPPR
jgi:hypothetical protein